jgi:NADH-quinone oxidoreductase subunit M
MIYLLSIFAPLFITPLLYFAKCSGKIFSLIYFSFLLYIYVSLYGDIDGGYLFLDQFLNVEKFGFALTLQVDKFSAIMLILTSMLLILVTLSSWSEKSGNYFYLLILFSGAIFGVFLTTNLLWFYIFWELTLLPIFILVGKWGAENRIYASIKFFLYTHFASMFMLVGFFLIFQGGGTFELTEISEQSLENRELIWWLILIGILVKVPSFPFHTWLPDAHVQAPAPISVLLAGVLLKMGAYALIKFIAVLFPETSSLYSSVIMALGVATLFFAGFVALSVTHIKKLVAYSSISHMGLVLIAISTLTVEGLSSALYEMIAHAFIISPLFLLTGIFHHKTGSWQMADYGGVMEKAPLLGAMFVFMGLASLGLPTTMGFVGELTIFLSAIQSWGYGIVIVALSGIITAGYLIWTVRRVIYGELSPTVKKANWKLSKIELIPIVAFALLTLIFGLYPQPIFSLIEGAF